MTTATASVQVRYADPPAPVAGRLVLQSDAARADAALTARLTRPGVTRDALLTLADVLASDLRRKAQDRSDYLAYLMKSGKKATKAVWDAQKEFLAERYGEARAETAALDPLATVGPDGLTLEVFSRDESTYARLHLRADAAYTALGPARAGTTHLSFSPAMLAAIRKVRGYRPTTLELAPSPADAPARDLAVPHRWLRAFAQMQAAATLPAHTFAIAPVDLYNVLFTLRMKKAKKPPRSLRYELVPGEPPRIVLEPWGIVLPGAAPFTGPRPEVIRTWGRNRLAVLSRLLPHATRIDVRLGGPGLPAFYLVDCGDLTLELALSGWTDSGWAGIATFDQLAATSDDPAVVRALLAELAAGPMTLDALAKATKRSPNVVRQALVTAMQQGDVAHDLAPAMPDRFRARPLLTTPLPAEALRYRDDGEREAHRLLATKGAVRIAKVHDLGAEGTQIEGEVEDAKAHRSYAPTFLLDREGRTAKASCSCPQFRKAGVREGPCPHMMALRLLHVRELAALEEARNTPAGRKRILAETRTLIRRQRDATTVYRVSLDDAHVVVRWGPDPERLRMQRLRFPSRDDARAAYFGRLEDLAHKGFIDATAAEQV